MKPAVSRPHRGYLLQGVKAEASALPPGLYVVATPIGNLRDITLRALDVLAAADIIACEDTRITSRLTRQYRIATPLVAYHEHNAAQQRPRILEGLAGGQAIALASDAGTPLVSDPGYRLVAEAIAAGHEVVPIPGASAMIAALVGSGLPTDTFLFAGFLPPRHAARTKRLRDLAGIRASLIFYEAPRRVAASLVDMAAQLGASRSGAVARELTKIFETFRRGPLAELAAQYADEPPPRGEVTIIVGPPGPVEESSADIDQALRQGLARQSLTKTVAEVATDSGLPRNAVYRRALAIKAENDANT